jgi:hypothetical protein
MELVLFNADLLAIIGGIQYVVLGADYKSIGAVCAFWRKTLVTPSRTRAHMDVLSTWLIRHPEMKEMIAGLVSNTHPSINYVKHTINLALYNNP